jgi:hypothetical protein
MGLQFLHGQVVSHLKDYVQKCSVKEEERITWKSALNIQPEMDYST